MDPTTRNHSYTPTPTTNLHWLLTGLDWNGLWETGCFETVSFVIML